MIDGFDNGILKNQLIDGSGVAFQSGRFQSADAAPDDRFNSSIVPVEPSEHFTTFSADNDLGEAVIAAIAAFLAIGTGFDHSPADKFFLYLQVNVLRNNGFVVTFYIVLQLSSRNSRSDSKISTISWMSRRKQLRNTAKRW